MTQDIQRLLAEHVKATTRCRYWSELAVKYADAGDTKKAGSAETRAREWMRRAIEIERSLKP